MAKQDYVAVAADDWYQRRREDEEGRFFRGVANQGPRKGEGGGTRQGIYLFTAGGKLLAYKNAGQNADVMRDVLREGLKAWNKLPPQEREPGSVQVGEAGKVDQRFVRPLPPGGAVIKTYTRILEKEGDGYVPGTCSVLGGERAARDHLWLTKEDLKELATLKPTPGRQHPLPGAITERILRFHLMDSTRGEPPYWTREQVREHDVRLIVEDASPQRVTFRLEGRALLATDADAAKAERGSDVRLSGYVTILPATNQLERFDVVAIGEHWGEGTYTKNARSGRQPLGIAFELAKGEGVDRVPPQAAREWQVYVGTGK